MGWIGNVVAIIHIERKKTCRYNKTRGAIWIAYKNNEVAECSKRNKHMKKLGRK